MTARHIIGRFSAAATLALLASGCVSSTPRNGVPQALADTAAVAGYQDIRFWGDAEPQRLDDLVATALAQRKANGRDVEHVGEQFLALSGGGSDGAFGAGLLAGWTAHGDRPEFDIVTGISTGAIIAPFAFLGPRYDSWLEKFYTAYGTDDLLRFEFVSGLLGGGGVADSKPLQDLVARFVNQAFLDEVAGEYRKGRRLLVGTTNLDAQRPVVWDLSAIAASGRPGSVELFRKAMLASAAIPAIFSPVRMDVQANGVRYQELHVDGSITAPVFFLPAPVQLGHVDKRLNIAPRRELYVIRNGKVDPQYAKVEDDLLSLTNRAFTTMSKSQTAGELLRLCLAARRDNVTFHLAHIPSDFSVQSQELFDRNYMTALFRTGFASGQKGTAWPESPAFCATDSQP
jgi:predicted patatin/cPLA2 family phospholipase